MARIRSVKPELRTSLVVAEWPREVRYFWTLLWGYLDDHGRGVDDARLVKADCFPLDDDLGSAEMDEWLGLIEASGPLCRFEVGGKRYMHVPSWTEHQRPSHPGKSRVPPCPLHDSPETFAKPSGDSPETLVPEQVVRAGSREQGAGVQHSASPEHQAEANARRIVRQATDCTEEEAKTIVAKVRERKPRSLPALLRTMARDGDLHTALNEIRAVKRKASVAAELERIRDGPACEHGQRGGESPHPTSGEPVCAQCRRKARMQGLNATAR